MPSSQANTKQAAAGVEVPYARFEAGINTCNISQSLIDYIPVEDSGRLFNICDPCVVSQPHNPYSHDCAGVEVLRAMSGAGRQASTFAKTRRA